MEEWRKGRKGRKGRGGEGRGGEKVSNVVEFGEWSTSRVERGPGRYGAVLVPLWSG